jgi:2'-5' RNA ligase
VGTVRLFVAVDPDEDTLAAASRAIERQRARAPSQKWAHAGGLHVTLAFLGQVDEARVPAIEAALAEVSGHHAPMRLRFAGAGTFGSPRRPRVLWIGVEGELDRLAALHVEVERALADLGFEPEERAWSAHLTLARAREPRGDAVLGECAAALRNEVFGEAICDAVVLYRSDLAPTGARYTPLLRAKLGPAAV